MRDGFGGVEFDEVRVISLPPPITAAVNRLLREESGWRLLDVRVTERPSEGPSDTAREIMVVYVLGHVADVPTSSTEDSPTGFPG